MTTQRCLAAAVVMLAVVAARAEDKAEDKMAPLARFAGEWAIDAKWAAGQPLHARGIYTWGLNKKIMTTKTFVRDGDREYQRYEGVFAWHPDKKGLYYINFSFDGAIGETMVEAKDADTFHIGWVPCDPGKPSQVRQVLTFLDNDRFRWIVSIKDGDEWKQIMDGTWKRKK